MSDPLAPESRLDRARTSFGPTAKQVAPAPLSASTEALLTISPPSSRAMVDDARTLGMDGNDVMRRTGAYARSFQETDPDQKEIPLTFQGATSYVGDRVRDGVVLSRIYSRWNDVVEGRATAAEAREYEAEQNKHLSGTGRDYGFLMDTIGTAAEITGQMYAGLRRGAMYAPPAAAGFGAAGALAFGVGAVPGAGVGLGVGFVAGAAHQAQIEATGALYADLISRPLKLYPDLDQPGKFLDPDDYMRLRRRDPRYTTGGGYQPQEIEMTPGLAKTVAIAAGGVTGLLEVAQIKVVSKLFGKSKILERAGSRVVEKLLRNGKLAGFIAHQGGRIAAAGAKETGIEAVQEAASYLGSYMAIEIDAAARDLGVPDDHRRELVAGLWDTMQQTAVQVGPAMMLLSAVPGTAGGVAQYITGRQQALRQRNLINGMDGNTEAYFDQQEDGENVQIMEINTDSDTTRALIDRERVVVKALLENTLGSSLKLSPVNVVARDGQRVVQGAVDTAIVETLRDAGYQSVRVQEVSTAAEEQAEVQQQADRVGAMIGKIDEALGAKPEVVPESVEGQIRAAFPQENDEGVRAMMIHLDLMADAAGVTTEQLLAQRYAEAIPAGRVGDLINMAPAPDGTEVTPLPFIGGQFAVPPARQPGLRGFDQTQAPEGVVKPRIVIDQ